MHLGKSERANYVINVVNNIETKYQQNVSESLVQITYRQYIDNNDPSEMSRGLAADITKYQQSVSESLRQRFAPISGNVNNLIGCWVSIKLENAYVISTAAAFNTTAGVFYFNVC